MNVIMLFWEKENFSWKISSHFWCLWKGFQTWLPSLQSFSLISFLQRWLPSHLLSWTDHLPHIVLWLSLSDRHLFRSCNRGSHCHTFAHLYFQNRILYLLSGTWSICREKWTWLSLQSATVRLLELLLMLCPSDSLVRLIIIVKRRKLMRGDRNTWSTKKEDEMHVTSSTIYSIQNNRFLNTRKISLICLLIWEQISQIHVQRNNIWLYGLWIWYGMYCTVPSSSKLAGVSIIRHRATRAFSPPESTRSFLSTSSPLNINWPKSARISECFKNRRCIRTLFW